MNQNTVLCTFVSFMYNYHKLLVAHRFPSGISLSLSKAKYILYFKNRTFLVELNNGIYCMKWLGVFSFPVSFIL